MKILAFLLIALICNEAQWADAYGFLGKKYEGWHWYEQKRQEKEKTKEKRMIHAELTPTEQIKATRELQEKLLHEAIISPTEENIVRYLNVQKIILDKSFNFTTAYQRVMQTHPELNETTKYPISQLGSHIYQKDKRKHRTDIISRAAKTYGLFYFYKNGCSYCERFIPIIKMFSQEYKFELVPISLDGNRHPELLNTRTSIKLAERLQIKAVPAVYLVEANGKKIIPVSFGFTAFDSLEERIALQLDYQQNEES